MLELSVFILSLLSLVNSQEKNTNEKQLKPKDRCCFQFDTDPHSLSCTQELKPQEFGSDRQSRHHCSDGTTKNRLQSLLDGKQKELQTHYPSF